MLPQELIRLKRDGGEIQPDDLRAFTAGMGDGSVGEPQMAAFAMAVFFQKMTLAERVALTEGMRDSGEVLHWDLPGPVLDKHSTGGIGDNVSLMLGPLIAACGGFVPMISGRGLGHTGGTLDKLDSIPGYNTNPDTTLFRQTVRDCGVAIIGQTATLAPADRRLYAVRDVTATVESLDLITASILSKKLAAGLQALVMDVKTGNGAFMESYDDAKALAESIVAVAKGAGVVTRAVITDMNEPLAPSAGNALEVIEAILYLSGETRPPRLHAVVLALGTELLLAAKLAPNRNQAKRDLTRALDTGKAAEHFAKMVTLLGGSSDFLETWEDHLPVAPVQVRFSSPSDGWVSRIDTRALGLAVVELGGGRKKTDDRIDLSVGLSQLAGLGQKVEKGEPLALIHASTENQARSALATLRKAYLLSDQPAAEQPVVYEVIS